MCSDEGERYIGLLSVSLRSGQGLTYVLRSGRWALWQDRSRGFSGRGGGSMVECLGGGFSKLPMRYPFVLSNFCYLCDNAWR